MGIPSILELETCMSDKHSLQRRTKHEMKVDFRKALEIKCMGDEHFFQRRTNLESDGMDLSIVPWKRITRGRRGIAL